MNVGEVWIVDFPFEDDPLNRNEDRALFLMLILLKYYQ
jgi:hypothetical protein